MGEQIWKLSEDSLVCLGAANWELVQRRREALKPQISRHYSHLCAQKTPYTDMLLGDNITKQIKDITDDNKVTDKVLDHNRKWPRMSSRGKEDLTEVIGKLVSTFPAVQFLALFTIEP